MFIELVESLRCVRDHPVTWLVARCDEMRDREIVTGVLGCPTCGAEYPIQSGVADFTLGSSVIGERRSASTELEAQAARAGGLLSLSDPGGIAVLVGEWGDAAHVLAGMVDSVHLLVLDPAPGLTSGDGVSLVQVSTVLPLRPSIARGVALDADHAHPEFVESAVTALRSSGRLVAPVSTPVPSGVHELARDSVDWVGERAETKFVELGRSGKR